jgi:hypothetical protein
VAVPQAGDHVPTVQDCPPGSASCDCTPGAEGKSCVPSGAWSGALKLFGSKTFRKDGPFSDGPGDATGPGGEPCPTTQIATAAPDCGAGLEPLLKGAWRTPSLRDVALTAPYMHDGYYASLSDVVQHYNRGGVPGAGAIFTLPPCRAAGAADAGAGSHAGICADAGAPNPHAAVQIKPLALTDAEVADLVAFLETLTGAPLPSDRASAPRPDAGTPADAHADGATDAHGAADAYPPADASTQQ